MKLSRLGIRSPRQPQAVQLELFTPRTVLCFGTLNSLQRFRDWCISIGATRGTSDAIWKVDGEYLHWIGSPEQVRGWDRIHTSFWVFDDMPPRLSSSFTSYLFNACEDSGLRLWQSPRRHFVPAEPISRYLRASPSPDLVDATAYGRAWMYAYDTEILLDGVSVTGFHRTGETIASAVLAGLLRSSNIDE